MKLKSLFATFALTISLITTGCGASDKLELLYFGKIKEDNQETYNRAKLLPKRLDEEPSDQDYYLENYGDQGVVLEAHVKNTNRLSFLDIVLYSASTGKKYVYTAGAGDYIVESSTVLSNNVWTTKLVFTWISWDVFGKETDKCFFDTYLEIEEINFLTVTGAVTRTNIANSDVKRVNIHVVEGREEYHTWSEYETTPATCEEWGKRTRHCTICNREQYYEEVPPLGHDCDNWEIQNSTPGVLQSGDKIVSIDECKRCHKKGSATLPNFDMPLNLVIPNDIITIEEGAFNGCSGLMSVVIPSSVTSIGSYAFGGCNNLMTVYFESEVPPQIGSDVFSGTWDRDAFRIYVPCNSGSAYRLVTAQYWQDYAVRHITDHLLEEVSVVSEATCEESGSRISKCRLCNQQFEEEILALGHTFTEWHDMTSTSQCGTDYYAQRECTRCHKIEREDHGSDANHNWQWSFEEGIKTISRDSSITKNCSKCGQSMTIGSENYNERNMITNIAIPESVTSIGERAFADFNSLVSITIPSGVTQLGEYVFDNCGSLRIVNYNAKNCSTTYHVFGGWNNITTLIIGDGVEVIPEYLFAECRNVQSVSIPASVKTIKSEAFHGLESLTTITIPESVTFISNRAFADCFNLQTVNYYAKNCVTDDGMAFDNCNNLTTFVIGNTVEVLPGHIVGGCRQVKNITIPNSVKELGDECFCSCESLTTITIPSSVLKIGRLAFSGCSSLSSVYFESEVPPQIGSDVFSGTWDKSDFKIYVPCGSGDAYKAIAAEYWQASAVRHIVDAHSYGEWVITTPATSCATVGKKERVCSKCGHKDVEEIRIEHTWSNWIKNEAESRFERECSVCGLKQTRKIGLDSTTNSDGKTVNFHYDSSGLLNYESIKISDGTFVSGSISSDGKISNSADIKWHLPVYDIAQVTIQFSIKMSLESHRSRMLESSSFAVKVNGIECPLILPTERTYEEVGFTMDVQYFSFANYNITQADITSGEIEIELIHSFPSGYRLLFTEDLRMVY